MVERTKVVEVPIETCTDFEVRKRKVRRIEPDSIESNVPLHVGANFDAELDSIYSFYLLFCFSDIKFSTISTFTA